MYGNLYNNFVPQNAFNLPQNQFSQASNSLIRVNGIEGAKAYQSAPNSTVALFDSANDIFYVKSFDGAGFGSIRVFSFNEVKNDNEIAKAEQFVSKTDFDSYKKELNEYVKQLISESSVRQNKVD